MEYTKLSALVDNKFTVQGVLGYKFKMWDTATSKMLVSDNPQKGYRKLWQVQTDKGQLDLGTGQMGNLLEGVMHGGSADIVNVTYEVKSNGKTGMEIRYYLNAIEKVDQKPEEQPEWSDSES